MLMGILPSLNGQGLYDLMLKGLYKETVPTIKVDSLKEIMQNDSPILLDTRSAEEYSVSHIADANHIDYESFDKSMVADLPKDKPVIVYCSVGYRSERIGEKLQEMGFKSVSNLYGGIFEWVNEGNTVVDTANTPTDSVHAYDKIWGLWLKKGTKVYE